MVGVDLEARSIDASAPGVGICEIPFDCLIIATGGQPSYFGYDEFAAYAPGLRTRTDAVTIRTWSVGGPRAWRSQGRSHKWRLSPCGGSSAGSIPRRVRSFWSRLGAEFFPPFAESLAEKAATRP